nr:reverse transcriptase domain-containing protein [uncultured Draconibacterium sp.]
MKKDNGKYRPLQIPEIRDRLVLKAISILLEEQLSNVLSESDDVSFAYQKGKGVREAVLKMKMSYSHGDVILKADIINVFEEVKKDKLLNELIYPNLTDSSINELIEKAMSQN